MRDLRNRLRAAVVLCAAGPVVSFLPSFSPARARAGGAVRPSCTEDLATRRSTARVPLGSTRLQGTAEQPEGHALSEGKEGDAAANSNGQDSLSNTAILEKPVAPAAAAESAVGTSSVRVGEEERSLSQTTPPVAQEVDAAASVGLSEEEKGVMEDLLAHQPGGEEDAGEMEGPPKPTRVRKRLKKYFPKDFQDTTWTVAVQWNHAKYEVQTTKVALKADGSVVWLDKGKGSWVLRTKSRDISIYRNYFLNWGGMRIYSAKLLDNTCDMYLSGVIKGWQPFVPLTKMGTWQAVRRGIKVDENTPRPPWESRDVVRDVTFGDGRKRKNTPIEIQVELD